MTDLATYFDNTGRDDVLTGGVKLIPIDTPRGTFNVWTKRIGNNPSVKILLLHGGPAMTHEYWEACDSFFPRAGFEYYYYDQLGSTHSDQPDFDDLWVTERFVEEVEQVRFALGLTSENFFLMGHSWGGILAIEYALAHQQNLKGLIISNMMSSVPAYNRYAAEVLMLAMDQGVLAEIKRFEATGTTEDPRYMELLMEHHYVHHALRMPIDAWPEPVNRSLAHTNQTIYTLMQGPSELGASGRLETWDRSADLSRITLPTLMIGATHDTMDPRHMEWMASSVARGTFLLCTEGSHWSMYDDQETYFEGVTRFIRNWS